LSGGPTQGNNTYGLFSFTGANSTLGAVNNPNYEQVNVTGTKLSLNNFSLTNTWATNVPAFFVIGAGGTVDNAVGNSTLNGHMSTILTGGALTNSGGGTFTSAGMITGYGSVSGVTFASGGITAKGGTLTVDGGAGMSVVSAGWGTAGGASDVLDVKGTLNFIPAGGFPAAPGLYAGGGTVKLDGATINTNTSSGTGFGTGLIQGSGQITVASGFNTLNGSLTQNANITVQNGATLNLQNNNTLSTAINATNFTMAQGSVLTTGPGNNGLTLDRQLLHPTNR
jgi:fibronectin-binding autotransporter adhesin